MVLLASLSGIFIALALFFSSNQYNRINRYVALYFLLISFYGLIHYLVIYSGNQFLIACGFINFSFLFLLPGPVLYFYVRGMLTGTQISLRKDWLHFVPAAIHLLMILPWICTDFSTKEALARTLIDEPNAVFHNALFKPIVSTIINYVLRSISGIGYAAYGLIMIYQHHEEKIDLSNRQQKYAFTWLYLFVFFQALLFLIYLINSLIAYTDSIEGLIYRHDSLYYISAGMVVSMQQSILVIFPFMLYSIPKKIYPTTTPLQPAAMA